MKGEKYRIFEMTFFDCIELEKKLSNKPFLVTDESELSEVYS